MRPHRRMGCQSLTSRRIVAEILREKFDDVIDTGRCYFLAIRPYVYVPKKMRFAVNIAGQSSFFFQKIPFIFSLGQNGGVANFHAALTV
jgi:hypothetical protein